MENFKKSKKAQIIQLVGIIITLLSGYLISDFIFTTSDITSTAAEDLACKNYIVLKSTTGGKALDFMSKISSTCKTEQLEIKTDTRDEVLDIVSNSMLNCWQRFGEGEYDFLSNFGTEGNWCFSCAKLNSKENIEPISFSNDLVEHLENKELKLSDGTKTTYYDSLRVKHYDGSELTLLDEIENGIAELRSMSNDADAISQPIIDAMADKNTEIYNLALKTYDFSDDVYVVYRYDRVPKETLEIIQDMGEGALIGMAIESIAVGGAGILLAPFTFGTSLALTAAQAAKVASKVKKVYDNSISLEKFLKVYKKIGESIKFSKPTGLGKVVAKAGAEALGKITNIKDSIKIFKNFDVDLGNQVEKLNKVYDKVDLDKLIDAKGDQLKNLQDLADRAIDSGVMNNNAMTRLVAKETKYADELNDLRNIQAEIRIDGNMGKVLESKKLVDYLKRTKKLTLAAAKLVPVTGAVVGGTVAGEYNSKYIQYVDLLNKEQYYRLCGTEPIIE